MDLAKQKRPFLNINLLKYLLYIPNIWLIYHLISIGFYLNLESFRDLIIDFQQIRNYFYVGYVTIGIVFAAIIICRIAKEEVFKTLFTKEGIINILQQKENNNPLSNFISVWVFNIVLTTYAFVLCFSVIIIYRFLIHKL